MEPVAIFVLAAYLSLLVELTCFPIPSEASTYQIFFEGKQDGPGHADPLIRAHRRSWSKKVLLYLLPTGLGVLLFLLPLAMLVFPELLDRLWPIEALRTPTAVAAGIALVVFGRALTFVSVLQLRRRKRSGALQAGGLFLLSRNPGLVGMYLFYLGIAFLFPCVVLFVGFLPYALNMHRRVLMEEGHLAGELGADYRRYLDDVPRYLSLRALVGRR